MIRTRMSRRRQPLSREGFRYSNLIFVDVHARVTFTAPHVPACLHLGSFDLWRNIRIQLSRALRLPLAMTVVHSGMRLSLKSVRSTTAVMARGKRVSETIRCEFRARQSRRIDRIEAPTAVHMTFPNPIGKVITTDFANGPAVRLPTSVDFDYPWLAKSFLQKLAAILSHDT